MRPYAELRKGYTWFLEGDVLFAKITPCMQNAKHAVARDLRDGVGFGSTEFHVLRAKPGTVAPEWVHYLVLQPWVLSGAESFFSGSVGQQRVPESYLAGLEIPLPPVDEQLRIIASIRQQLAAVGRARRAAAERVGAARRLSRVIVEALLDRSAPDWTAAELGEISEIVGGIQKSPSRAPSRHHRPFLTVRNVQRGYLDLSVVERFEITPQELDRPRLQAGDLLIVEGNGSLDHIGRNALFEDDGQEWIHQNHVIRVRLIQSRCLPQFISLYLNSDDGRRQMIEKARTSSGLFTLSAGKVAKLEVPIPPMNVQTEVVAELGRRVASAKVALAAAEAELGAIEALPAALLREAFEDGP